MGGNTKKIDFLEQQSHPLDIFKDSVDVGQG